MKKFIKILSIFLAFVCVFSLFSCKKKKNKNEVELAVLLAGFGETPYRELAKKYMEMNPGVQVKIRFDELIDSTVGGQMDSSHNLPDIYSVKNLKMIKSYAAKGKVLKLNDLLNSQFGEGYVEADKTVGSNYTQAAIDECSFNSETYCLPEYTNVSGFVYNKTLFDKLEIEIPTTTKELKQVCEEILEKSNYTVAPITFCSESASGYYYFAVDNWLSLYAGKTNMENFFKFEDPEQFNPNSEISKGKKWAHENLKIFLDTLEPIKTGDTTSYKKGTGYAIDSKTAERAQAALIYGEAAMMLNGSWFENEMSEVLDEVSSVFVAPILKDVVTGPEDLELGMFRIPEMVIPSSQSAISSSNNVYRAQGYDTVDGKPVIKAESGAYYFIPSDADNVELAIDFLKFLSSDEASVIYTANSNAPRAVNYNLDYTSSDYAHMSSFGKNVIDIVHSSYVFCPASNNPLFIDGKISLYPRGDYWCKDVLEGVEISTLIQQDYDRVSQNWDKWVKEYGLA